MGAAASKKVQLTEERTDDADHGKEEHFAKRPQLSLDEQKAKLRDEEIWGFHCDKCGYDQISPMLRCPKCAGGTISTRKYSNTGKVVSYTIQSVASEQFLNETPFAFAIIQLDDGPKISGWIPYIARAAELPMGTKVHFVSSYKPGMMFEKD